MLNHCYIHWATAWQNQQNDLCTQQRLSSAWASTKSDHSLHCLHEKAFGPWLWLEPKWRLIRQGRCPGWSESSLGARHFVHFVMCWLILIYSSTNRLTITEVVYLCNHACNFFCFILEINYLVVDIKMSCLVIKPTKWVCAQLRLRSAWACAKSDQSLHSLHEESLDP